MRSSDGGHRMAVIGWRSSRGGRGPDPRVLRAPGPILAEGPLGPFGPFAPFALDRHEPVSDVAHGADQGFVLGAELGAQPPDVHVHRPRAAEVVIAPDLLQQLRAGENPARVLG